MFPRAIAIATLGAASALVAYFLFALGGDGDLEDKSAPARDPIGGGPGADRRPSPVYPEPTPGRIVQQSPEVERGLNDLHSFLQELADPKRARALADAAEKVFAHWARQDPWKLRNLAAQMESSALRNDALLQSLRGFVQRGDTLEAIAALEKLPGSDQRTKGIRTIAGAFGAGNGSAGLEWAAKLKSPQERGVAGASLVSKFADAGRLDEIADVVNKIDDPYVRQTGLAAISTAMARNGDAAALESWLQQLDPALRDQARAATVGLQAENLPFAEKTIAQIGDPFQRSQARQSILQSLFKSSSPANAANWVMRIPSEAERMETTFALVNLWEGTDSQGLENWLRNLPIGKLKDYALQTHANRLRGMDPQRARQQALQIKNEGVRKSVLAGIH